MLVFVRNLPEAKICDYTVKCKWCGENVPAPVQTMPDTWIIAACPLRRERRYYLPPKIFYGRLSCRLRRRPVQPEREVR